MLRLVLLLILLVLVGLGVFALSGLPGSVWVELPGWQGRMPLVVAGLLVLLAGALIALVVWVLAGLWSLPKRLGRTQERGRERKASTALVDGLLAVEGGDAVAARKYASRAARHGAEPRLALLLEARAAEEAGDWADAERAWAELKRLPGASLPALKGLATAALQRGDTGTAEARNREAIALKSGANWPFHALFDLQVQQGKWAAALATLDIGERKGLVGADASRRRRAVLLTADAQRLAASDRSAASRTLADAIRAAPGFPPAAWLGARHLLDDSKGKAAQQILLLAWKARPHPSLARLARSAFQPGERPEAVRNRARALIEALPEHRESRVLAAELAMETRDWLGALKELAGALEAEAPTSRLALLMAEALRGYGDRAEAERWQRLAATAPHEPDWSDLDVRGAAFAYTPAEWARLVYEFGDGARLIHPRQEQGARLLEPVAPLGLPAPVVSAPTPRPAAGPGLSVPVVSTSASPPVRTAKAAIPPLDYAPED